MSFSSEWNAIYQARARQAAWPWSDLISYVCRHGPKQLEGCRVLELGCGSGANIPFFAAAGAEYFAVEGSAHAVELVHQRHPELVGRVVVGDFTTTLPFDGPFDLVVDRSSLTHNTASAIQNTLLALQRLMRPGARLIGIDWFSDRHSDRQFGQRQADAWTYGEFSAGQFAGYGQVHLSDEAHLRALLADFRLLALEHKEVSDYLTRAGSVRASWNFAVEKP